MKTPFPSHNKKNDSSKKTDPDNWKKKYYNLLKELDQQEHNWGDIETALRRSLSRLTALGRGQSTELDNKLDSLRSLVREKAPCEQLGTLVDEIIDHEDFPEEDQTRPASTIGGSTQGLDTTRSHRVLDLIIEISLLTGKDGERSGKWQDWQRQLKQPDAELNILATEIIRELTDRPVAEADLYQITADALRTLLEQLSLPGALLPQMHRVRKQLATELDHNSVAMAVTAIADLARAAQHDLEQQRKELEQFLLQLTQRLQDMDQALADSSEYSQRGLQNVQEMNQAVQNEMVGISNQVESAEELGVLKKAVQQHLVKIEKRLNDHIDEEIQHDHKYRRHVERLVSRLGKMEEETRHLRLRVSEERARALTDKLTGVSNRLAFDEHLEQELTRWKRYKNPLSLIFWDIDHFKLVNDRLGHKAGDKILQALGALLNKRLRESDFTARFGGEEFISILQEELSPAAKVADEIRAAIANFKFNYQGQRVPVSISCGVTQCREGDTPSSLVERADQALYKAKEDGRNRCEIAT